MSDKNIELLKNKIADYLTEIISLKGNISTLEEEKKKLNKELSSERNTTKKLQSKIVELEQEIENLRSEIEAINKSKDKK